MTNAVATSDKKMASAAVSSKNKTAAKKDVGDKKAPTIKSHPPMAQMVNEALAALKGRKGSSLQAIKKYIASTYTLDIEKQAPYIRKYLKSAVADETIVQSTGIGASGSFKLAGKKAAKKSAAEKPAGKKSPMKKTAKAKEVKDKSPMKAKKNATPTANTKSPKPKKVVFKTTKPAKKKKI